MIKNQLYPYVEKYINEYLYGFTKEQLEVGVMNGVIQLEKLNIRPDKANEKLDKQESPIWLKAGLIKKINVGCSLMNFIGEKPLEVEIEDIEILLCPSFKWIIRNQFSFLEETEEHLLEEYDAKDNNSKDIFFKKVHIFDGSIFKKKQKLIEFLKDKSKIAELVHKLFTKVMKFYYQTNYFVNAKVKNVHIRFEDDTFNYYGGTIFGISIESIDISLSADGSFKKDNFKITNLNVYHEDVKSGENFLVTSNQFLSKLNSDVIDEDYFKIIEDLYDSSNKKSNHQTKLAKTQRINILEGFNCMGRLGVSSADAKVELFTSSKKKPLKFFLNVFTNDIKININPAIIGKMISFQDFLKGYYLNDPIQDFKPMRKPYDVKSELVQMNEVNEVFKIKRKLVVRDWLYYFIWYSRFKTAIYGKPFKNKMQEEFSKYFNICCANQNDVFPQEFDLGLNKNNDAKMNDSIELKKKKKEEDNKEKNKDKSKEEKKENENPNPDDITLSIIFEFNIKSISVNFHEDKNRLEINSVEEKDLKVNSSGINTLDKKQTSKHDNTVTFKLDNFEVKISTNGKDNVESSITLKNISMLNYVNGEAIKLEVTNMMETNLGLDSADKRIKKDKIQGKLFLKLLNI